MNARVMYAKGLDLASTALKRGSSESEGQRYSECLTMLNEIRNIESMLETIPSTFSSSKDVQKAIRVLLSVKEKCPKWREMYLKLAHYYLLLSDINSAEIVLSRVMPNLLPSFTGSTDYPFSIAAWDAEKLDLFNSDVSAVDVDLIALWVQLFIMQKQLNKVDLLLEKCRQEPRFRDEKQAEILLSPFWNIRELQVGFQRSFKVENREKRSSCIPL